MLSERKLLSILKQQRVAALGQGGSAGAATGSESDLQTQREEAQNAYLGRAVGDFAGPEGEDRSHIVSRDLFDVVEWILPSMIEMFIADDVVNFTPTTKGDEDQARQESDAVNHIFLKKNKGYMIMYNWFKDTFLSKNGYVHAEWVDKTKTVVEEYTGLDPIAQAQLAVDLAQDESLIRDEDGIPFEVVEQEENGDKADITIRMKKRKKCVHVQGIPAEDMLISARPFLDIQDVDYIGHKAMLTRSELIEMGFEKSVINKLPKHDQDFDDSEIARSTTLDEISETGTSDKSMDEIEVFLEYPLIDFDEDGIAERRRIMSAGDKVLENKETDLVNYASLTAIPMPHRHTGLGIFDALKDLMQIKTMLWRQLIDNAVNANNPGHVINERTINIDDILIDTPRRVVRNDGDIANAIMALPVENIMGRILPALQYTDSVAEKRTGGSGASLAVDPNVLSQATKGNFAEGLSAANLRIKGIARIFAETGVRDLMLVIHTLMVKHQDFRVDEFIRKQWIPIDPRSWRRRDDLTIEVGLGTNSQEEIRQNLLLLGQLQEKAIQVPNVVTAKNVFNLATDIAKKLGFQKAERYFTDPETLPPPQPQPDPIIASTSIAEQARTLREQMKLFLKQLELQEKGRQADMEHAREVADLELQHDRDIGQSGIGSELEN